MHIIYHKQVYSPLNSVSRFAHVCLHQDIQNFIEKLELKQNSYFIKCSSAWLHINLSNGDRIDVQLN